MRPDQADPARRRLLRRLALAACWPGIGVAAHAQSQRDQGLAVLYPEVAEPFRSFFAKILDGIDEKLQVKTYKLAVPGGADVAATVAELRRRELKVVIALGRAGLRAASALDRGVELVGGAVMRPGEGEAREATVLSLAPDPLLLLRRLKTLLPGVKRVSVVYSPRNSGWLLAFAQDAARQNGLELQVQPVEDIKAALRGYQDFFARASPHDALWLPQDQVAVDESVVLPFVLQESWNRSLPLFSSTSEHVRRGVLFSLYPNNLELGRSLGALALARLAKDNAGAHGLLPLRDVHAALNTRTATHLGVELTAQLQRGYELLVPER
ncbi:ABC transporter substrate binding protein [Rugamonas sp. CCM 8940]|uniref:ABC transporter substrate binding protein n=1 Tax=Rugamonas sp. CCM 8940 TaxID=2765359 RepID=UPI0018F3191D|nr:ABC transporter substrate binding protein [Rugamonas sp. CCM 8940]MBJ7313622.1 hypothetical protein [Rugamonas sp. CCM 8940]